MVGNADRFLLLGPALAKVASVGSDGLSIHDWDAPSDLVPMLTQAVPRADGSFLLSGAVDDFDGPHGWVGKVDPAWKLEWETELEDARIFPGNLAGLSDDGAIFMSSLLPENAANPGPTTDVVWTRLSSSGEVIWRQHVTFDAQGGGWMGLTSEPDPRIIIVAADASSLVVGDLDSSYQIVPLQTSLTSLVSAAMLPNGRLALVGHVGDNIGGRGQVHMTMLELDGTVVWERDYGTGVDRGRTHVANGLVFNTARGELTLAGNNQLYGSWLLATTLDGEPTWELNRKQNPTNIDGEVWSVAADKGPILDDLAVSPDGTLLATGSSTQGLVYFVVGAGSCR